MDIRVNPKLLAAVAVLTIAVPVFSGLLSAYLIVAYFSFIVPLVLVPAILVLVMFIAGQKAAENPKTSGRSETVYWVAAIGLVVASWVSFLVWYWGSQSMWLSGPLQLLTVYVPVACHAFSALSEGIIYAARKRLKWIAVVPTTASIFGVFTVILAAFMTVPLD